MDIGLVQASLSLASGLLVGFSLGLIGGGGSILAVPLLIYVVGVRDTHVAIATSAAAVAASALANLLLHARGGSVKWRCASLFAAFGIIGAAAGSTMGKMTQGDLLLGLFGLVMIIVGLSMIREKSGGSDPDVRLTAATALRLTPRLAAGGFVVGALSGFFGIGGGFLGVPGLVEFLSGVCTLEPGDLVFTGTPAGVGAAQGRCLRVGQSVESHIAGVGRLDNLCT